MQSEKPIKDHVIHGSFDDLLSSLKDMQRKFEEVYEWVELSVERNNKTLPVFNLFSSVIQYLKVLSLSVGQHVSVLALSTRSLYELNLTLRSVIGSQEGLDLWCSELVTDKIQAIEGLLEIKTVSHMTEQRKILQAEIDRIKKIRQRHKLPEVKTPASAGQLANLLGLSDEHRSLYKLFSKIVHPSSYLVNDYGSAASVEVQMILQIHAQLYAWDSFSRFCDRFNVPEAIRS
jgi:hypothetical protein